MSMKKILVVTDGHPARGPSEHHHRPPQGITRRQSMTPNEHTDTRREGSR